MAASEVEICNLALSWVAGNLITSLDDDLPEAKLCKANFRMSRRAVLSLRQWSFAMKRVILPVLTNEPKFGFSFEYLLPSDFLTNVGVYRPSDSDDIDAAQTPHRFENGRILASVSPINFRYVFDQSNVMLFSPLFDQTLAAHLAMNIAVPLTENKTVFDTMAKLFQFNLDEAAAADGRGGTREKLVPSTMERSRRLHFGAS